MRTIASRSQEQEVSDRRPLHAEPVGLLLEILREDIERHDWDASDRITSGACRIRREEHFWFSI